MSAIIKAGKEAQMISEEYIEGLFLALSGRLLYRLLLNMFLFP
jgi:hypothetical protein